MKTEPRFRLACQQRNASYSLPCSGGFLTRLGGARGDRGLHKAGLSSPSVAYLGDEGGT